METKIEFDVFSDEYVDSMDFDYGNGKFVGKIKNAHIVETSKYKNDNYGRALVLELMIYEGKNYGHKLLDYINIYNKSEVAELIARKKLRKIAISVGLDSIKDCSQLINRIIGIDVEQKENNLNGKKMPSIKSYYSAGKEFEEENLRYKEVALAELEEITF